MKMKTEKNGPWNFWNRPVTTFVNNFIKKLVSSSGVNFRESRTPQFSAPPDFWKTTLLAYSRGTLYLFRRFFQNLKTNRRCRLIDAFQVIPSLFKWRRRFEVTPVCFKILCRYWTHLMAGNFLSALLFKYFVAFQIASSLFNVNHRLKNYTVAL